MTNNGKVKIYKRDYDYSYTIGAYPTVELIRNRPDAVREIVVHSRFTGFGELHGGELAGRDISYDDKVFQRLGVNDNSFVIGVFGKYDMRLAGDRPHIVLVNPSDMGNLGTIIRTVLGLGYTDIAVITPAADVWHPKTIRASMGAVFRVNVQCFCSFDEYRERFQAHGLFPFMLGGRSLLDSEMCTDSGLFSLVFGNEATGLDRSFLDVGDAVRIPQTGDVDSLNLAVAVGIGAYAFAIKGGLM